MHQGFEVWARHLNGRNNCKESKIDELCLPCIVLHFYLTTLRKQNKNFTPGIDHEVSEGKQGRIVLAKNSA